MTSDCNMSVWINVSVLKSNIALLLLFGLIVDFDHHHFRKRKRSWIVCYPPFPVSLTSWFHGKIDVYKNKFYLLHHTWQCVWERNLNKIRVLMFMYICIILKLICKSKALFRTYPCTKPNQIYNIIYGGSLFHFFSLSLFLPPLWAPR